MRVRAPGVPAAGPGGSAATAGPGSCREDAVTGAFPPTIVSSGTAVVDADGAAIAPGRFSLATKIVGSSCVSVSYGSRSIRGSIIVDIAPLAPSSDLLLG